MQLCWIQKAQKLIDDGLIEMTVKAIEETDIVCEVINGGYVSNHKGINVPGVVLSMPYISEVDREDILFGVKMGYDYLAASFVRCREDVEAVRKLITDNGGKMKIISKIENMQGIGGIGWHYGGTRRYGRRSSNGRSSNFTERINSKNYSSGENRNYSNTDAGFHDEESKTYQSRNNRCCKCNL